MSEYAISETDIFIIDIDLNTSFSGIDLAKLIRKKNKSCYIIFVTSNINYAVSVINENIFPIGYIQKSVPRKNLFDELTNILKIIESSIAKKYVGEKDYLSILNHASPTFIKFNDILYVSSIKFSRSQIVINTVTEELIINSSISKIKRELPESIFILSLQSYIINLFQIKEIDKKNNTITFINNDYLILGTRIINKIYKALMEVRV